MKFTYYSIATSTLTISSINANPAQTINQDFPRSGLQLLSSTISDSTTLNNILNHGCWCAKISNPNNNDLGGSQPVDELDNLCKQWFTMRNCNDQHQGGSCFDSASGPKEFYNLKGSGSNCSPNIDDCEKESCQIDVRFSEEISNYVADQNVNFVQATSCPKFGAQALTKYCLGDAPFRYLSTEWPTETTTTTEEPNLEQLCENAEFDVTILVDGSGSVLPEQWEKSMDFVDSLIDTFDIGAGKTAVTLSQFSFHQKYYTRMHVWPNYVANKAKEMRNDQYKSSTMTNVALNGIMRNIATYGRPGVPQILVLLTDGASSRSLFYPSESNPDRYNTAEKLHELGINSFVVAIGDEVDNEENKLIASNPDDEYLFSIDSFGSLDTVGQQISRTACTLSKSDLNRSGKGLIKPTFVAEGRDAPVETQEDDTSVVLGIAEDQSDF